MRDLTGHKYGKLTVLGFTGIANKLAGTQWICQCKCGKIELLYRNRLRTKNRPTKCCGCTYAPLGHNAKNSATYRSWMNMTQRCLYKKDRCYYLYGGRGITICSKWRTFKGFFEDMGSRPEGMTLDRIDPNGNYEKDNCRWATAEVQAKNRRNNVRN